MRGRLPIYLVAAMMPPSPHHAMFRLLDLDTLTTSTVDSLAEVARALHGRSVGSMILDVLGDLDGEQHYLPLIELDVQFADDADVLLPHVAA